MSLVYVETPSPLRYFCIEAEESPLTLELAKSWLKITVSSDDVVIQRVINDIISYAERTTGRSTRIKTWYAYADDFPLTSFELRRQPIDEVTEVRHTVDGSPVIVATSVYSLKKNSYYARLVLKDGQIWPTNTDALVNAVRITFKTKADVKTPEILTAMLKHLSHAYENRGDDAQVNGDVSLRDHTFYRNTSLPQF